MTPVDGVYLTDDFGGMSDMHHGRGDLQAREIPPFDGLLIFLLIIFLSTKKKKLR